MQGHWSAVGFLPDSINLDYGSTPSNVAIDQQIFWNNVSDPAESGLSDFRTSATNSDTYMGTAGREDRHVSRWHAGESSSSIPQTLVNHGEQMLQNLWSSSTSASAGPMLREYGTPNNFLHHNVDLNIVSDEFVDGTSFARSFDAGSTSKNSDINLGISAHVGCDHVECPHLSKSSGLESKLIHSGSSSSDPFVSASGSGGFLEEEDKETHGCSLDGGRLSCKRKALEGHDEQSLNGGSCFTRPESSSIWQDAGSSLSASTPSENLVGIGSSEQVTPRLGLGHGGMVSERFHAPNVPGGESSQRNFRMRINSSNLPDSVLSNSLPPSINSRRLDVPLVRQRLRFVPSNPPLNLMSPAPLDNAPPQHQSAALRMPALHGHAHGLRWNGASSLRTGSSSGFVAPGERDATSHEDSNLRTRLCNIGDHPMFVPSEVNFGQNPMNFRLSSGTGLSANIASSSRSRSASGCHSSLGPNTTCRHPASSEYNRRLSEVVRRSLLSSVAPEIVGQSSNASLHHSVPTPSQAVGLPTGAGNQGLNQVYPRSALWMEGHGDGAFGMPSLRTMAVGEGRSRVVSEMRNLLDIMRRGEGLRFEALQNIMVLDQNLLFGMADIHDQHGDMRLDVDNMSYEELLVLEERIGYVCTGLSEETVMKRMKQRKHLSIMKDDQTEAEPCCVCQEEYNDGEDLGSLDCGHDFHTECIKQWLTRKNLCPVCKTTALSTS